MSAGSHLVQAGRRLEKPSLHDQLRLAPQTRVDRVRGRRPLLGKREPRQIPHGSPVRGAEHAFVRQWRDQAPRRLLEIAAVCERQRCRQRRVRRPRRGCRIVARILGALAHLIPPWSGLDCDKQAIRYRGPSCGSVSCRGVIVTEAVSAYLEALRPQPDHVLAEMEAHAAREHVPVVVPRDRPAAARAGARMRRPADRRGRHRDRGVDAVPRAGTAARRARSSRSRSTPTVMPRQGLPRSGRSRRPGRSATAGRSRGACLARDGRLRPRVHRRRQGQYGDYFDQLLPLLRQGRRPGRRQRADVRHRRRGPQRWQLDPEQIAPRARSTSS